MVSGNLPTALGSAENSLSSSCIQAHNHTLFLVESLFSRVKVVSLLRIFVFFMLFF